MLSCATATKAIFAVTGHSFAERNDYHLRQRTFRLKYIRLPLHDPIVISQPYTAYYYTDYRLTSINRKKKNTPYTRKTRAMSC